MNIGKFVKLTLTISMLTICMNGIGQNDSNDIFSDKEKFEDFVYTNTHYPIIDLINNMEGTAIYKYDLDSIYKIHQFKIIHSSGSNTLDWEGLRLLYLMPRQDNTYPTREISINFKLADNKIYRESEVLEDPPEFPGGKAEMMRFIAQNLHYPPEAVEMSIQGRIFCGFVVEKDGSIGSIEIVRSLDHLFDAEAMRVIKRMPNWITGKINGKPVRVYYIVPIRIQLQ
jgi:TonB family C-terminal domain